ncbi:WD40-repeat-containing domain protein [Mycena rebaudengoi]|nr:WD40-repeat-containing domain protein [Mycena rebaudengoi]
MSSTAIPRLHLVTSVKAHTDNINTIAFSEDGKHFASGGDDALLRVSEARSGKATHQYKLVSPIRCVVWTPGYNNLLTTGLRNGIVLTIQIQRNNKCLQFEHSVDGSVHCMAFDITGKWFAIGYNNEVLIVRQSSISTWSNEKKLPTPLDFQGNKDITRAVQFHTREKLLLVTYLFGGIVAYNIQELGFGVVHWHIDVDALCGGSALSPSSRLLALTDLSNCIHWYDTANEKLVSTTQHGSVSNDNVILPVIFIGPNIIVVGSATGEVAIFKSGNPHPLQLLSHNGEMVQEMAYYYNQNENLYILVTGISEQFEECTLNIWIGKGKTQMPRPLLPWQTGFYVLAIALAALFASRNYEALRSSVKSGYQKAVEDIRALNQISQMKEPDSGKIVTSIPTPLIGSQERTASHVAAEEAITRDEAENLD